MKFWQTAGEDLLNNVRSRNETTAKLSSPKCQEETFENLNHFTQERLGNTSHPPQCIAVNVRVGLPKFCQSFTGGLRHSGPIVPVRPSRGHGAATPDK